jgi:predicted DsbA family dithiol-disulfide isomerase
MRVEIWSDVVCPWCYVGKRRFEQALASFPHRDEVEVVWRSFELDPSAPAERSGSQAEHLAAKYGLSPQRAQEMLDTMTATAAVDGLDFRFDRMRGGSTFDAHRLLHLAAEHGLQGELKERLLHATFTEGAPVADQETLVALAVEVGLGEDEVRDVLRSSRFADEVRADQRDAQRFGITGVPFFVVDRTYGVSGAQPADVLRSVLDKAWQDSRPVQLVTTGGTGPGCEGDACAV